VASFRLKALTIQLRSLGSPARYNQAALEIDRLRLLASSYQPGTLMQPDDFAELAAALRAS